VVWLVSGVARLLNRFMLAEEARPIISEDEIRSIISVGEQTGVVPKEQRRMLHGVFELSQIRVRDVMIPRTEVAGIEVNSTFEEALALARRSRHSRFPVYEGSLDSIVGLIHSKDILNYVGTPEAFDLRKIARPPYFVPESKRIETLLQSFRRKRVHLAVVVDEYGGVEGIVTLEDIFEEIVGEIEDEYDDVEEHIIKVSDTEAVLDGRVSIDELNELLHVSIEAQDFDTVGGCVFHLLGRMPTVGDEAQADGVRLHVLSVEGHRVKRVRAILEPKPEPENGHGNGKNGNGKNGSAEGESADVQSS
jgi:putative hemolysin